MLNSLIMKQVKATRGTAKTAKIGVTMYLEQASVKLVEFTSKAGESFEKAFLNGTDALTGLDISGVEYDGKPFEGVKKFAMATGCHTRVVKDRETGDIIGKYDHARGLLPLDKETFQMLVSEEEKAQNSAGSDTGSDVV